ncbi:MAG TPA: rhodanese-like domain-containing protein [Usitatibacter sp.]|nr:rhodanese-like domain-containing protein [Usitatibacter sp.]
MTKTLDAKTLKRWLSDGAEIALLDVREHGQYGESHLFFGVPLPYSRLEIDAPRLVPRRSTRIVLYDDGSLAVAQIAARRLEAVGYTEVNVLQDGTRGWERAGFRLFAGVNVPSKAFGELVERECHTPRISAADLARMQRSGEPVAVVDGRPLAEFRKMSIPGARCCPNGELAYRVRAMVPDERMPIVVNCAGRTRSIIGAQTLIDLGIPNPVRALENGTQGWYLADLELEHGATRGYPDIAPASDLSGARTGAQAMAKRCGVRSIEDEEASAWLTDPDRTTYLFDVRTAEEFSASTIPGAVHAPGGQLVQATDQWVGVRHARLLVFDSGDVRAPVVASWLARMGHEAAVLRAGAASRARPHWVAPALASIESIGARDLQAARDTAVVDLRPSTAYRKAHLAGSRWSIRPRLAQVEARVANRRMVLVADDPAIACIAAIDLREAGVPRVAALEGGFEAWRAAGGAVESSPDRPTDAECIDYLFFVHDRHEGNKDSARRYLAWETQLLSQLDEQELGAYRLVMVGGR